MGKKLDVGVSNIAQKGKKAWIGVDKVARKWKKAWIGDANGIARLFFSGGVSRLVLFNNGSNTSYRSKYSDDHGETWTDIPDIYESMAKTTASNGAIICMQAPSDSGSVYRNLGYTINGEEFTLDAKTGVYTGTLQYIPELDAFVHINGRTSYTYVYYSEDGKTWDRSFYSSNVKLGSNSPLVYDTVNKQELFINNGNIVTGGNAYPPLKNSWTTVYDWDSDANYPYEAREECGLATHDGLTITQIFANGTGASDYVIYSLDAKTWTKYYCGCNTIMYSLRYIKDRFIAFCEDDGGGKYTLYTFDGKSWTRGGAYIDRPSINTEIIDLGNELIYGTGNRIYSSIDGGLSWTIKKTFSSTDKIAGIVMSYLE